jgi:hypothetical protein
MNVTARQKLVLIAGLQKSGTTLLLRLLVEHTSAAESPFSGVEGHDFWGNVPSHAPCEFPAGDVYMRHNGDLGHEIPAAYADGHVRHVLAERLARLPLRTAVIVNKNPYHTLRLPWLKAIFPDSFIVCTVRQAVANIYSLLKKHLRPDERDRPWREDRWYGVKPRHWRTMLDDDPLVQCTNQWCSVMQKLWEDRSHVDLFIGYRQLCADPAGALRLILNRLCGAAATDPIDVPPLRCYDDEFRGGSALRSKNEAPHLAPAASEKIELPPLTANQVAHIQTRCGELQNRIESLCHRIQSAGRL